MQGNGVGFHANTLLGQGIFEAGIKSLHKLSRLAKWREPRKNKRS